MTSAKRQGKILTFYSYKGGTGRSMALANVAWILASSGKRVLAVDWDLEAPGLHRYFYPFLMDKDLTSSDGVIDFVNEFADAAMTPAQQGEELAGDWYLPYANILRYASSLKWDFRNGRLDFIPAGRQGISYASRVTSFSWPNFYERLGGNALIEAAKEKMRAAYDYILIDSRTGVSDTSGICTIQLPDILVLCFTLNNQSVEGASAVATSVCEQRARDGVRIFPVPMRIEMGEKDKLQARRNYAHKKFLSFIGHMSKDEREQYWGAVEFLYVPYYAYEEILASFSDRPQELNSVLAAAVRLTSYLTDGEVKESAPIPDRERAKVLAEYAYQSQEIDPAEQQAQAAENLYARLPTTEQDAVRRVFTRLVRPTHSDEIGNETLLRVAISDFNSTERKVLNVFSNTHLVTIELNGGGEPTAVKVADDALIRGWKRLQGWIENDREFLLWRQQLKTFIKNWEDSGRDEGALLSGELLAKAERRREQRGDDLNEAEKHYLNESALAESNRVKQTAKLMENEKQHVRWRIFNRATVLFLLLILAASGYAIWYAYRQKQEREEEIRQNLRTSFTNYQQGLSELALCDVEKDEDKRKSHLDAATKNFQDAIELNPQYAEAYNGLGRTLYKSGQDDQAIENFSKAIELKPEYTEAYLNRGLAYLDKGNLQTKDYDQVIADFSQVINSNAKNPQSPQTPLAYNGRGIAYWKRGDFEMAVSDLAKATELKRDYAEPYHNFGTIYAERGDFEQAINNFDKAIILNDSDVEVYFERAQVYEKRGDQKKKDKESAIADYRMAYLYTKDSQKPELKKIAEQAAQSLDRLGESVLGQRLAAKPRVVLFFVGTLDAKLQFMILSALSNRNYDVRPGEPDPLAGTIGEVKYFYDEDEENADKIRSVVQRSLNQAEAKDQSGSKIALRLSPAIEWAQRLRKPIAPGTIEVWIPPLFEPPVDTYGSDPFETIDKATSVRRKKATRR